MGFVLSAAFAAVEGWSLHELCWGLWLAGLVSSWALLVAGATRIALAPRAALPSRLLDQPWFAALPPWVWRGLAPSLAIVVGVAFYHFYASLFGFYGIFLSVFAEMEPHAYFGRNGFINSDFSTPVVYLLERLWPVAAGAVITDLPLALTGNPWRAVRLPFSVQLLPIHLLVIGLPFMTLLLWWAVGADYQTPAVILVLALFHFMPRPVPAEPRRPAVGD